jgi:hypothetical protein
MARSKVALLALSDDLVNAAESKVRSERFVKTKQLIPGRLARPDELVLIETLVRRGLERTPSGIRVALSEQLAAAIHEGERVALTQLRKRVAGATATEVKRTVHRLVSAGELALVSAGRTDEVTRAGPHVLTGPELVAIGELARALAKLGARVKPKKNTPDRTLLREEVSRLLDPFLAVLAHAPRPSPVSPRGVLEALGALGRPSGRSVFIPSLARALGPGATAEALRAVLFELARSGRVELRPESGVGNLSAEDAALCPRDASGTIISYARVIGGVGP